MNIIQILYDSRACFLYLLSGVSYHLKSKSPSDKDPDSDSAHKPSKAAKHHQVPPAPHLALSSHRPNQRRSSTASLQQHSGAIQRPSSS